MAGQESDLDPADIDERLDRIADGLADLKERALIVLARLDERAAADHQVCGDCTPDIERADAGHQVSDDRTPDTEPWEQVLADDVEARLDRLEAGTRECERLLGILRARLALRALRRAEAER